MSSQKIEEHMTVAAKSVGHTLRSKYGIWGLALISFTESALPVPLITDPFLIAYILANKKDTIYAIFITTASSILGGVAAYLIAVGFFEIVIAPYISESTANHIHIASSSFTEGTFLLTFTGAITPVPYTFVAIGAGLVQASLFVFILASLLGRGLRYSIEGLLVYHFGESALKIVKKQIVATTIICVIAILLYLAYKI